MDYLGSPSYTAWRGNAFELVCINHIEQIKETLKISGVGTNVYAWRSHKKESGAQIDLLIERKDGIINLCEAKYSNDEYEMTITEYKKIMNAIDLYTNEMHPKAAIHPTLISANGIKRNKYSNMFVNIIDGNDLFKMI